MSLFSLFDRQVTDPHPVDAALRVRSGLEYPELLFIIAGTLTIIRHAQTHGQVALSALTLVPLVGIGCVIVFYYGYKKGVSFALSVITSILLGAIVGLMQFCSVMMICFSLLFIMRVVSTAIEHRLRLIVYTFIAAGLSYLLTTQLDNYHFHCEVWTQVSMLALTGLIASGRFWYAYQGFITANSQLQQRQHRMDTMVSVISKLTKFIPPQVWQPVVRLDAPIKIANKRTKITIMFADIVGFTELAERLSPDELADVLNTYMRVMSDLANKHEAVLDKFIGDGLVCFFGAPSSKGIREDALACVAMALDMRREMQRLQHYWHLQGFEGLSIRIGINTGYCHVGNFGSNTRVTYTVIGSEANLAARLEGAAKENSILISAATYNYTHHEYKCVYEGELNLKGFETPIKSYAVIDTQEQAKKLLNWIEYDLPGFNLHLNFKDIKNYDYERIQTHLYKALEQLDDYTTLPKDKSQ